MLQDLTPSSHRNADGEVAVLPDGIRFVLPGNHSFTPRGALLTALFVLFLVPLSVQFGGFGPVSANYSFVLLPLLVAIFGATFRQPDKEIISIAIFYTALFFLALTVQYQNFHFIDRRIASFAIFMTAFIYTPMRIDEEMVRSFKLAIVAIAVFHSVETIDKYFAAGGSSIGYLAKGAVGGQRFAFILILGFWLVFQYRARGAIAYIAKCAALYALFNGMMLTFTRANVVAALGSVALYVAYRLVSWVRRPHGWTPEELSRFFLNAFACALIVGLSYAVFPVTFEFYSSRMIDLNITPIRDGYYAYGQLPPYDTYVYNVIESSEGYRIFIFSKIFEYVFHNPIFGSGFLGVWVMFPDPDWSAHNQLFDVLFRTGPLGFLIYLYLLYRILRHFHRENESGLFWGLIGVLLFGMFHETFKLSQGAFVFAFMVAMTFQAGWGERRTPPPATPV